MHETHERRPRNIFDLLSVPKTVYDSANASLNAVTKQGYK